MRRILCLGLVGIFVFLPECQALPLLAAEPEVPSLAEETAESPEVAVSTKEASTSAGKRSTPSPSSSPTEPPSLTPIPVPTFTPAPTATPSSSLTPTPTALATSTFTPTPSSTPSAIPSSTLKPTPQRTRPRRKPALLKKHFQGKEPIEVTLGDYDAEGLKIIITNNKGERIPFKEHLDVGKIQLSFSQSFRPGKYTLRVSDEEEMVFQDEFSWGVLAINTHKSIYLPNEEARFEMAVLDEQGMMVCDASLKLKIRNEKLKIDDELSTEEGTIRVNPECNLHGFTLKPDYEAEYQVGEVGVYELELTAETKNGSCTVTDAFSVRESVPFDIERNVATRIYPPETYPVTFKITASEDFEGVIEETVPADFELSPPVNNQPYNHLTIQQSSKIISWEVSVKKGDKLNLGYYFDAPDTSPQFYLLGPLTFKIKNKNENVKNTEQITKINEVTGNLQVEATSSATVNYSAIQSFNHSEIFFQEARQWQIAADGTCTSKATGNWSASGTWNTGCSGVGGVPTSADNVTISNGNIVTVDTTAQANSVALAQNTGNNQQNGITISSTNNLTITNALTIPAQNYNKTTTVAVGAGSLSAGSISISGGSRASTVSVSSGTITVTGSITFGGTAGNAQLTSTSTSTINIGGNLGSGGTLTTSGTDTINFNGGSAQTIGTYTTFNKVQINNTSGGVTLTGTTTFGGTLQVQQGTLNVGAYTLGVTGATTVSGSTSNLTISSTTGTKTFTGDVTISSSGTWNESAAEDISFDGSLTNNATFTATTGVHTFTGSSKTISGTVSIPNLTISGTVQNNGILTVSTALEGAGTLTNGANATLNLGGTSGITGLTAVASSNTVNYTGSGQTIKNTTYVNLTINGTISTGTQTATVGGVFSVTNTFTPSAGTMTFNNGSSISNSGSLTFVNLAIAGSASVSTSSSFYVSGNWNSDGSFSASNGTITFNGGDGSTQVFTGNSTFYNLTASTASNTTGRTLQFTGSSTTTVSGTWTITGYSGKVITLQSSDTNNWAINPTAVSVTYVDVYRSTNTGTSFCSTYSTKDANCVGWNVSAGGSCNQNPNSPSSLAQKKTDDTVLDVGDWTKETSVKFTATADDPDSSDTLYLCVEKDELGTSFSNTEDSCGSGVAYSGSPVTITVTIAGIPDAYQYHWQARVKDASNEYSSWVSYESNGEEERDFGVDTTVPSGGIIYDGSEAGVDQDFNNGSLSQLSANWTGFDASVSDLNHYEYSIGTTAGGTDVKTWTGNGTATSVTATSLDLQTSTVYYFNVRAVDNAGNVQSSFPSSDGQIVSPSLSFSISPSTLSFANLNTGNNYTDNKTATLTTSTNAYGGYVVRAYVTDYLRSVDSNFTIGDFDGGTYTSPDEWLSGDRGYGYTSSDTTIQEVDKFNSNPCSGGGTPPCYVPFSHTGPGDILADHTDNVTGSPIGNEQFTVNHQVKTDDIQEASAYVTTVVYTVNAQY